MVNAVTVLRACKTTQESAVAKSHVDRMRLLAALTIFTLFAIPSSESFISASSVNGRMSGQVPLDNNNNASKRAPLKDCDLPQEGIVPNHYVVYLIPGYSLEDHKRTVGDDVLPESSI